MEENKQSSVDWLQDCLSIHFTYDQKMQFEGLFQQAKEIEKNQHEETWIAALDFSIAKMKDFNYRELIDAFNKHYNETFKGGEQC